MRVSNPRHQLTLGAMSFCREPASVGDYAVEVLGDGMDVGGPEAVVRVVQSLLQDGDLVVKDRDGNRTVTFKVRISASDGIGLARGEAALVAELGQRNDLTWTPPDGWAPASVFTVLTSSAKFEFNDINELRVVRMFSVTLTCMPFVRSLRWVEDNTESPSGTVTTLSDGSTATGWSSAIVGEGTTPNPTAVTSDAGSLKLPHEFVPSGFFKQTATLYADVKYTIPGGPANYTLTPFVSVRLQVGTPFTVESQIELYVTDGLGSDVACIPRGSSRSASGWVTFSFQIPADKVAAVTAFGVRVDATASSSATTDVIMRVDDLKVSGYNVLAPTGAKQSLTAVAVRGSVRGPGSLRLVGTGLPYRLVYQSPMLAAGYEPRWRSFQTPAPVSGSATASGFPLHSLLSTADGNLVLDVPADMLPAGGYNLLVRSTGHTTGDGPFDPEPAPVQVTTTAQLRSAAGTPVGQTQTSVQKVRCIIDLALGPTWRVPSRWINLGAFHLPGITPGGTGGNVRITIAVSVGQYFEIDDVYGLHMGDGSALTAIEGAADYTWLEPPSIERPFPALFEGSALDKSDAYTPVKIVNWGAHRHMFIPPSTALLAVGCAIDAFGHYPHWHSNAAE
jgi:hypothetical protein